MTTTGIRAFLLAAVLLCLLTFGLIATLITMGTPSASDNSLANPLAPPDTASPRATIASLQSEMGTAERLMRETYARHIKEPGFFMSQETLKAQDLIAAHIERATHALDLSGVPPGNRGKTALETAMLLNEILGRIGLPPVDRIPDAAGMKAETDKGERAQWIVPNSEIQIARIASGPRAGEYLFSPDTVARAYEFYQKVRSLPPRDGFDFYAFYALSPGELVPPKWYAQIQKLPSWFHEVYIDSARWQWIALGLTIFVALFACFGFYRTTRPGGMVANRAKPWLTSLILPVGVLVAIWCAWDFIDLLNFTGPVQRLLASTFEIIIFMPLTWLAVVACNELADWVAVAWDARHYSFDAGILRVVIRLIGILIAAGMLTYGASQLGVPLVGIIAGLGVGGLAIGLAAQPTIENFIGGIMIYADRPVRVGDHCKVGDISGVVEEIGIRSTRIRTSDRSVTIIPNSDFSKSKLVNLTNRDRVMFSTTIGLEYGTKEKQLREVLKKVRALLSSHPHMNPKSVGVHFAGFGSGSLLIEVRGDLEPMHNDELTEMREDINLKLFTLVEKSGAKLAAHG
jgi:MscS family membrane protein